MNPLHNERTPMTPKTNMTNVKLSNAPDAFAWPIATALDDSALRALVRAMISSEAVSPTDARWVRGGGL